MNIEILQKNKGDKKNKGYDGTHKRSKKDIGTKAEKEPIKHTIVPDHNAAPTVEEEEILPSLSEVQRNVREKKVHRMKPKNMKIITAYEQCKMECRMKRDLEEAKELEIELLKQSCRMDARGVSCTKAQLSNYIARLKTELSEAEAALAESIKKEEAEEPQKSFIEVHVDNVPESPKQENIVL
ncbi:unnamed protein product [Enterobius vermicularis]|uniref:Cwf21 domain-containing protein n=1 Tax=Enterobius vermicularis TaxID=51028 RepID=A0A0N4VCQ2_ENTVE|nr:unnamed protein product [Enterobius vermicularis]